MFEGVSSINVAIARVEQIKARFQNGRASHITSFPDVVAASSTSTPKTINPDLERAIQSSAEQNSLDPALIKAVIHAESGFNTCAISRAGARGLMQLMPSTANALGVQDVFNPQENIAAGSRYLRQMLDRFGGDVPSALAAYNAGPNAVRRYGGIPPYPETQRYVAKVMDLVGQYQQ